MMRKTVEEMLEEGYGGGGGRLGFSCERIEISLCPGESFEGSFRIFAPEGQFTDGTVLSSDLRMECLTQEFTGCDEEIRFCFHGGHLEDGDVAKGSFCIVSNRGEYSLPFTVSAGCEPPDSSIGAVRNLFHFANLAKNSWQEAVKLFYSPGFTRVLSGGDAKYAESYRALSVSPGSEQNMEEFLIHAEKKQKVEFLVQEGQLSLEAPRSAEPYAVFESRLTVLRSGWGYTRLCVECDGDFLFVEKQTLTDDDFLGNRCELSVFIDGNFCREGKNYGQIFLYNAFVSLTIPVTVSREAGRVRDPRTAVRKRCTLRLMEIFQAFRAKQISTEDWLKESGRLVEKLAAMDESDVSARLYQAQVLITQERFNEAGWILDHVAGLLDKGRKGGNETLRAYHLYLGTLLHGDRASVDEAAAEAARLFRADKGNWRAAWLLLHLSEEYRKSAAGKWSFLEKQCAEGSSSPILYLEAVALMNSNPALLRKLGVFERRILWYGARKDLLRAEVTGQLLYLADKSKENSDVLYRTLCRLYEKGADVDILRQICALLIKGGKAGSRYFAWYRLGVENNLRITNLYEYYMMSLDLNTMQEIPKSALLYFSYQNSLDYEHTAYLYNYILQGGEGLRDICDTYRPRMEYFCMEQLAKGRVDKQLAALYHRLLKPEMITEQTCGPLSEILFAHLIRVADERVRTVYVYQPGNLYPVCRPLSGGEAWIALYGDGETLVFEDAWHNRYIKTVEYTIEELMRPGPFLDRLLTFRPDNPEMNLHLCGGNEGSGQSSNRDLNRVESAEGAARIRRVAESGRVGDRVRRRLTLELLQYYHKVNALDELDEYLLRIDPEVFSCEERARVLRFIALRGNLDLAERWLRVYGPYAVDAGLLVRLLAPLMERSGMERDEVLGACAVYAFERGKYNSAVLRYLSMYHEGGAGSLRDVWKAARSFGMDCLRLSEVILAQLLYTGSSLEDEMAVFRYYVSQGAKPALEEAFLARRAGEYFLEGGEAQRDLFDGIGRMCLRGESVRTECKLAFLKYHAERQDKMTQGEAQLAEAFLEELTAQQICLEFFRKYRNSASVAGRMADKAIIEYRADPGARVRLYCALLPEDGEPEEYSRVPVREVCDGLFAGDFILFFGETLRYRITQEVDGEERLMESASLQKSDMDAERAEGRYHLINSIARCRAVGDPARADRLLEEYCRKDFLNERLFELR